MNAPARSNPPPGVPAKGLSRLARLASLFALLGSACASPLGGEELALSLSGRAGPAAGAGLSLAQRLVERGPRHLDFELGVERQRLDDAGPRGDDWTRAWGGLRLAPSLPEAHLDGSAGVTWIRSEGSSSAVPVPGDYGGAFLSLGWTWELSSAWLTGPEITAMVVDAEGNRAGTESLLQISWRWVWRP